MPGLYKAAKLAISLNFAVKLEVVQRLDQPVIDELGQVLDLYLHRPNVAAPIEFFHSTFLALYRGGYFKLPDKQYQCDGVKGLFRTLKEAAGDLQLNLEMYRQAQEV